MREQIILSGVAFPLVAAETIAENRLVALNGDGKMVYADAGMIPVGICYDGCANAAWGTAQAPGGLMQCVASAAINTGEFVKVANDGKVAPEATVTTKTVATFGVAKTTAAGDGSYVWIIPLCC